MAHNWVGLFISGYPLLIIACYASFLTYNSEHYNWISFEDFGKKERK